MYKINWTDDRETDICNRFKDVEDIVSNIGPDRGCIKWVQQRQAIVCYHSEIIAYVTYFEQDIKEALPDKLIRNTVHNISHDGTKNLLIAYDKYVQEMIANKKSEEIKNLLYFISFMNW